LINPREEEEYIDYKTYPLNIDWQEIENEESHAYDIYDKYGCFGAGLNTCLSRIKGLKLTQKYFIKNILEYYLKSSISLATLTNIYNYDKELVENLPSLEEMNRVIELKISKKELVCVKVVLDIYEHYLIKYDGPSYEVILIIFII
jgi:hypothetical protein